MNEGPRSLVDRGPSYVFSSHPRRQGHASELRSCAPGSTGSTRHPSRPRPCLQRSSASSAARCSRTGYNGFLTLAASPLAHPQCPHLHSFLFPSVPLLGRCGGDSCSPLAPHSPEPPHDSRPRRGVYGGEWSRARRNVGRLRGTQNAWPIHGSATHQPPLALPLHHEDARLAGADVVVLPGSSVDFAYSRRG